MISLLALAFAATLLTGPAFEELRSERRARLDEPAARVTYLPSSACRADFGKRFDADQR